MTDKDRLLITKTIAILWAIALAVSLNLDTMKEVGTIDFSPEIDLTSGLIVFSIIVQFHFELRRRIDASQLSEAETNASPEKDDENSIN